MKSYQKIYKTIIIGSLILSFALSFVQVQAETIFDSMNEAIGAFSLPTGGDNPDQAAQQIVGRVIQAFLSLFGVFFLVLIIYGGYRWMNARGNQEEIEKAKKIISGAVIGLIIVIAAYAISVFVTTALQEATQSQPPAS